MAVSIKVMRDGAEARGIDLMDPNFILVANGAMGPLQDTADARRIEFGESCVLEDHFETVAALREKYSRHVRASPGRVGFVNDPEWKPSRNAGGNSGWKIDIAKSPFWFKALTGFDYMAKLRQHWVDGWTVAQFRAAVMSQLLRIDPQKGAVKRYTEDFSSALIATFGIGYLEPGTIIPDLLLDDVRIRGFRPASGQLGMVGIVDGWEGDVDAGA
jgi:hypothetical protein